MIYLLKLFSKDNDRVTCDFLAYPLITDDEVHPSEWIWETREFEKPMFTNINIGEIFLMEIKTDINGSYLKKYYDADLLDKAKKYDKLWKDYIIKQWNKLDNDLFY